MKITRKFEWDSGHRVYGHEGKCRHLHGHRYVAEVCVESPGLDSLGRVIDFSVLKSKIGKWIDENWDHNFLINPLDPLRSVNPELLEGKKFFLMPQGNPTAENMAECLFFVCHSLFDSSSGIEVVSVRIYETPNCWADYVSTQFSGP